MSTSILEGLRKYIDDSAASGGKDVHVDAQPQANSIPTQPYIVISRASMERPKSLGNASTAWMKETVNLAVYAMTPIVAQGLAGAVADDLAAYTGLMGTDRKAVNVTVDDADSGFAQAEFGEDPGRFYDSKTITIEHVPAA